MNVKSRLKYLKSLEFVSNSRLEQFGGAEASKILSNIDVFPAKFNREFKFDLENMFGRIFETVAIAFLKRKGVTIHYLDPVKSVKYPITYNPDGIISRENELNLLEIKCPLRRFDVKNIKATTMNQILIGLDILPVDYGELYHFRFRICCLDDLKYNSRYNAWFHYQNNNPPKEKKPTIIGFIRVKDGPLVDIGRVNYDKKYLISKFKRINEKQVFFNIKPIRGTVIPFKLFRHDRLKVMPEKDFLDMNQDIIWKKYEFLPINDSK